MSDGAAPTAPGAEPARAPVVEGHEEALYTPANRPILIVGAMAAMLMQVLDTTIANVALPHMQATLSATTDTITWVLTSYVLATAIALPAAGWMVDKLGIRTVFVGSVVGFTLASVLCGSAQTLPQMVFFRVVQGVAGAFLAPLAQTTLLDVSSAKERPRMMILFSQGVLIGPILGPLLGGYITESYSWRWVFFINVPIGAITALVLFAMLPKQKGRARSFDKRGWLVLAVGLGAFQLMLDRGPSQDWFDSAEIVAYAVMSASAAWMAIVHLVTKQDSIFPRDLFRDANLVLCAAMTFVLGIMLMSVMALLPGLLQSLQGYTAVDTGWLMTPRGFGMLISMTLAGKLIQSLDPRISVGAGLAITGYSMWMMKSWALVMPASDIFIAGLVQGCGFALMFMPLQILAFATLPGKFRTDATSLLNLVRNIGQSIGLAVCTVLLSRNIQINHAEIGSRVTHSSLPVDPAQLDRFGNMGEAAMRTLDGMVTQQAAMIAYLNDFYLMAWVSWAAIPLLLFARPPKRGKAQTAPADIPH